MKYISTRGGAAPGDFREVVLGGQAPDGGLFLPESYPDLTPNKDLDFLSLAAEVMAPFAPGLDIPRILKSAWAALKSPDPAPLVELDDGLWLLELFHGPTLSFKDFGLQFLGAVFAGLSRKPLNVIGATSGDTGAAAVHALKGREGVRLFMLHPKGRISNLQRRQMTTVDSENIYNLAIEGSFDDCQRLMKGILSDPYFQGKFTTINSINWGRILAQTSYYWHAALKLGGKNPVHFVVPSGNFGNAFSGYVARQSGAPISGITVATNKNDILARALKTGVYQPGKAEPTISPAMDIQAANNFERLLFEATGGDSKAVKKTAWQLEEKGQYKISEPAFEKITGFFSADIATEKETRLAIRDCFDRFGVVIDPHTAVGFAIWKKLQKTLKSPVVLLATAHPAKFPETVPHALLKSVGLPAALASLKQAKEVCSTMTADPGDLKTFIKKQIHDG